MKVTTNLLAFNRGLMSPLALARVDLKRAGMSAEIMKNWMPRTLGPMMLRPGLGYLRNTLNNKKAFHIPFVFSTSDFALLELTDNNMRIFVGGDELVAAGALDTWILNPWFNPGDELTSWTDADEAGAVSDWASTSHMRLVGTGNTSARRRQVVTVAALDQNREHFVRLEITRGTGRIKLGTTAGGGEYRDIAFLPGEYQIAFTPTGDFHVELSSGTSEQTLVKAVLGHWSGGGTQGVQLPTPWTEEMLPTIRFAQSGDVIFVAAEGVAPMRIERHSTNSWAVVSYLPEGGPFGPMNLGPVSLTPAALSGTTTLTASANLFTAGHVGALFRLASNGQRVEASITAEGQFTAPIRVAGIGSGRVFSVTRSGTWAGNVRLQRSVGAPGDWANVEFWPTNGEVSFDDKLDNQIIYYRLGIPVGDYTSGTAVVSLLFAAGTISGTARVVSITSPTVAVVDTLSAFGNLTATFDWWEGTWSPRRGYPTSVALFEGRLWWAGRDQINASVSDAYSNFDDEVEGDSGPISRSIGAGPVDVINWLLPLSHLLLGGEGSEKVARSSSFDEPLTPSQFRLNPVSTLGSSKVAAETVDVTGIFVHRNRSRIYELVYDGGAFTYTARDLTAIVPEIGLPGVVRMAVQRQPDTRVHCVREDGTVAILVFDSAEEVTCWIEIESPGGFVEDVVMLPGAPEDRVYYTVRRQGVVTRRTAEQWAMESEGLGGTITKLADGFVVYEGVATDTFTGINHLEGQEVCVWADGRDRGRFTVPAGEHTLTVPFTFTAAVVGIPYKATFKSARLAHSLQDGRLSLGERQRLTHVGLLLANTHAQGLRYGQDFDHLDALPLVERGTVVGEDVIHAGYEEDSVEVNGTWDTDARLCLEAESPRPCTVLACLVDGVLNMKG